MYFHRLVEEIKSECEVKLTVEDVYMNTVFEELLTCVIKRGRGIEDKEPFTFDAVSTDFLWDLFSISYTVSYQQLNLVV